MNAEATLAALLAVLHERQRHCPICGGEYACTAGCALDGVWFVPASVAALMPRELHCPRCDHYFADPDPAKEFPAGIMCPHCREVNRGGLVGVIHPRRIA